VVFDRSTLRIFAATSTLPSAESVPPVSWTA